MIGIFPAERFDRFGNDQLPLVIAELVEFTSVGRQTCRASARRRSETEFTLKAVEVDFAGFQERCRYDRHDSVDSECWHCC